MQDVWLSVDLDPSDDLSRAHRKTDTRQGSQLLLAGLEGLTAPIQLAGTAALHLQCWLFNFGCASVCY